MLNKLKQRKQGFTIIEVLIVLAIAGLILLIVFLAVPALQRNSRNTQRRNDVARELGAAQEVLNNNNGLMASLTTANIVAATGTLGYYQAGPTVTAMAAGVASGAGLNSTTVDTTTLYTAATCDTAVGQVGKAISGTARQVALVYKIEPAVIQCTNS